MTGDGEPPIELLCAAIACAASGEVCGIPVQELREDDAIGDLDLSELDVTEGGGRRTEHKYDNGCAMEK